MMAKLKKDAYTEAFKNLKKSGVLVAIEFLCDFFIINKICSSNKGSRREGRYSKEETCVVEFLPGAAKKICIHS